MKKLSLTNGEIIRIETKPFAGGGEGNLFHIAEPLHLSHRYIVKIYHPHKLTAQRQEKLKYLLENPPVGGLNENPESTAVIWVHDLLYDKNGRLLGFTMPFTRGEKLELLTTLKLPKNVDKAWQRFDFKNDEALGYRMRLCFNIAVALRQVHSTERYVLVDLKPDNIVVQPHGIISLVDMDSVEVVQDGESVFDAPVATPEYTPPEHYRTLDYDPTGRQAWDRFSMAVIFYKLLFGIHPFAGGSKAPYDDCLTLEQKIEAGLFVHNPSAQPYMSVIPPPHQGFHKLPKEIQTLFLRAFIDGHQDPELRPTAEEWCVELLQAIDDPRLKAVFGHLILPTSLEDIRVVRRKISEVLSTPEYTVDKARGIIPEWLTQLDKLQTLPTIQPQPVLGLDYKRFSKQRTQGTNWVIGGLIFFVWVFSNILGLRIFRVIEPFIEFFGKIFEAIFEVLNIDDDFIPIALIILAVFSIIGLVRLTKWASYRFSKEVRQKGLIKKNLNFAYKKFRSVWDELQGYTQQVANIPKEVYVEEVYAQNQARIESLKNSLIAQDPEVEQLVAMEKAAYIDLHETYLQKALQDPMLSDLDGSSLRELREQLMGNKVESEAWLRSKAALDSILSQYQSDFQQLKKSFDGRYHSILLEARKKLDETILEITEEEERSKKEFELELNSRIPLTQLEKLQKQLNQEKFKLEILETEKEKHKEISFKNFRKNR